MKKNTSFFIFLLTRTTYSQLQLRKQASKFESRDKYKQWTVRMTRTRMTCFPRTSSFKSNEIEGRPLETVPDPYDSTRMKSTVMGRWIFRARSAVNRNAPVATPTTAGETFPDSKSWVIWEPSWETRSEICCSVHRIFSMWSFKSIDGGRGNEGFHEGLVSRLKYITIGCMYIFGPNDFYLFFQIIAF